MTATVAVEQDISAYEALKTKIKNKSITVGVIGLGYVGLPLLIEKVTAGLNVVGFDLNEARVMQLSQRESYIGDISNKVLASAFDSGRFRVTSNSNLMGEADVLVICVPTPLDKHDCPDLTYVTSACHDISQCLRPGQLISLESTTYPGTTQEILRPILEKSGLSVGKDFFLAYSSERVDPGNTRFTTKNTNKVVGADDQKSLELASAFYRLAIERLVIVSNTKTAEMAKVFENTFRSVNVALVNQMTLLCHQMDIDVWEMLDAAFTKPFGIMPFYPGPGVGGHCIPVDPHYLEWKAKELHFNTSLINLSGEINRSMPNFVVERVQKILNKKMQSVNGAKLLIIGVSYKENVGDCRDAPAIQVIKLLQEEGAKIQYHDPYVESLDVNGYIYNSTSLIEKNLVDQNCVLILTNHRAVDYHLIAQSAKLIFDTRNVAELKSVASVIRL